MSETVQDRAVQAVGTWRDDWPVAVVAAGAAAVVWVGATVAGVDVAVRSGSSTRDVGLVSVVVTAVVVAVAGAGLLRVLERRTPGARRVWTGVAMAVWVVSLAGTGRCSDRAGGADPGCPPSGGRCRGDRRAPPPARGPRDQTA